jgi:hypothetical protein
MLSPDQMEDKYADMPPLEELSNLPMEMYYGDDEKEEQIEKQEEQEIIPESFEYEGIELIDYVNDFIDNQRNYFQLIKSYCMGNNVFVYIQENGQVLSAGILDIDNKVHEFTRITNEENKTHDSIWKWVNDYYGKVLTGSEMMNRVYIGKNFVPLWRILLDAYEEDNDISVSLETYDKEYDNRISYVFISILIILVLIVGFLFMINII